MTEAVCDALRTTRGHVLHAGRLVTALFVIISLTGSAHAQVVPEEYEEDAAPEEERAERLREARLEKREQIVQEEVEMPGPGIVTRATGFFSQDLLEDFPFINLNVPGTQLVLGGLRSGAGSAAGLRFAPFDQQYGPHFSLTGRVSLNRYWGLQSILGYNAGPLTAYGFGSYMHIPQERFYGVGPQTTNEYVSNFRWDRGIAGALVGIRPLSNVTLGGHASYQHNMLGPGKDDAYPDLRNYFLMYEDDFNSGIPGLDAGGNYQAADYLMLGGYAEYDTRQVITEEHGIIDLSNDPVYESRFAPIEQRLRGISLDADQGVYLAGEVIRHQAFESQPFSFTRYKLEAQEYLPIRNGFQVIALRQFASLSATQNDHEVPFYMMETLGGGRTIRGFDTFRFRDRNVLVANSEFRWQAWVRLDMALFLDAGYAFHDLNDDFAFEEIETGYGLGFRVKTSRRTAARLDFAWSREGMTTYLRLGSFL